MKNKYNFPQHATNSNNNEYNEYVEDLFFETEKYGYEPKNVKSDKNRKHLCNGRIDIYHNQSDSENFQEDPYTVAQKFINRTQFPM